MNKIKIKNWLTTSKNHT